MAACRHPPSGADFADLVLAEDLTARLSALVSEVTKWEQLDYHGIPRRQRILFHGTPGCGKTSVAESIAAELGWPLLVVRLDAVVSSFLGETASNLHRIFDFARNGSWVLLFDEFDALGKPAMIRASTARSNA